MDEPLLTCRNVNVRFGDLKAVDGVSFDLHAGHLLGLIGPNGAGKTTLLRALAGLQTRTAGDVVLMGQLLVPENADPLAFIGFTPDNPPVYEQLTVRVFLEFAARGYNLDPVQAAERIDFWLEKVWLSEKKDTRIKALSRGMRQRLGLARTLLANPPIILLDEPAAGLDPAGRVQFRQLLASLRDQGKALIVSSHILSDMAEYCTHIGIMTAGRMHQFGTVDHVTSAAHADPRCRYTLTLAEPAADAAALIGAIPDVTDVLVDRHRVTVCWHADPKLAPTLLRALVATGLPITSFTANTPDLEEVYLRTGIRQVE